MLSPAENYRLVRVGASTPMGEMLRRYWIPAIPSSELIAGGQPRRVRLLGEDLVAFRLEDGTVGVLDEHCPHRGASLTLARNEGCALQCLYHGWKIDASGSILDTPAEPERSSFKSRIRQISYPAREAGALVWTYMGPPGSEPDLPSFDWTEKNEDQILILRCQINCNWTQSMEGGLDSAHQTYLHDSKARIERDRAHVEKLTREGRDLTDGFDETGQVIRPWADGRPKLQIEMTEYGFRYAAIRKPLAQADRYKCVRVTHFVAPFYALIPSPAGWSQLLMHVPIDDHNTLFMHLRAKLDGKYDDETRLVHIRAAGVELGVDIDSDLNRVGNRQNNWLQDRHEMRDGDRFSGIRGTINEDAAVQESMGPIFDRSREHLGTSDMAVIRFRKVMLDALRRFEDGEPPVGLAKPVPYRLLRGEERTVLTDVPWQSIGGVPAIDSAPVDPS
jgi:phthalate 4,5-dioxygenase oxygenase subunit